MIPYFIMVGTPAVIAILGKKLADRELRNRLIVGSFFLIWLTLLILRKETVGIDLVNYHSWFLSASRMSMGEIFSRAFQTNYELGYNLLSKFVSLFTHDFRVMIIITAILSLVPVWLLYRENAEQNAYLSIVIFLGLGLFSIYFSAIRQVLAIAFVYPAYTFTKKRKLLLFLLTVFLTFFIHHSAIIMLLMYPVYHLRLRNYTSLLLIVPVIVLVYIFRVPVFRFLSRFIGEFYQGVIAETGAITVFLLLNIFLIYSFFLPNNTLLDEETIGLRNILFMATVLQIFTGINLVAMRMNYYFLILVPLLIPRIMNRPAEKNRKLAELSLLIMAVFFSAFYFYRAYTSADILQVYPYIPFWK